LSTVQLYCMYVFVFKWHNLHPTVIMTKFGYRKYNGRLERILTMVFVVQNSQNFSGLFPSSCIWD
jgi:hypothetical protein